MDSAERSENSKLPNEVARRLLDSLKSFYNINFFDVPYLVARCDYFEKSERFMVSKKANLWSCNAEEFIYLFYVQNLTVDVFEQCMSYVDCDWQKIANIGPNHMYTYVTPIFVCDNYIEDALKKLQKCKIYKSFKFSFHGWMEYHCALVCDDEIFSNRRGKCVKKMLSKVINKD